MSDAPQQSAEFLLGRLAYEQEANRKLRALLARAADALEAFSNEFSRSPREQSYPSCPELIAELDAEIEQPKFLNAEERATIDELAKLLARAADALEEHVYVKRSSNLNVDVSELIDELRHAADLMIHRSDSVPKDQGAVQDCADRSGPYSNPID